MKHAINAKTLEQSALAAHALFIKSRDSRLDWLVDRHFVVEHLVPTLLCRLQAHLPMRACELVELWAEHLGLSETLLEAWRSKLEPIFSEYLHLLASELQAQAQNPHLVLRMLSRAG
ncbi:hypothetical protein [Meiothermus sp.]|jgi:hypothetical protein|uniref:hypothetical protein n=1 Tax=Meiothermus sp. TaxID=1955249 RepID=UPI0021DC5345|nr:hypothetical protein [Meiothermus sp.]GIW24602.1 MAG: hypothetical protein KatS3mg069_0869 [Meiothermus sp.]